MNAHRLLNRFLGIFLATIGFSSPAFAALPDGLQDITAAMANGTATLASFVTGFAHTNTCGLNMSADSTPGADGYYYNAPSATSADFTVSADAVNVATFDLTALSFTNYSDLADYSFTITGIKPDSTQVQTTFNATGKTFTSGDYTNFTGIKSFHVQFSSGDNVSNITFDSFTIANAAAPNTAPTAGTVTTNNVTQTDAGATSYTFTIPYSDTDGNFDSTTVDTSDVTVSGGATVTGASYSGTSSIGTATYTVTPPGGSWDDSDNGTYTIGIVGSQVADSSSAYVAANATVGSFTVAMDTTAAAPSLSLASDTGSSNTDKVTSNGTVNVSGMESGATWQYSTDGSTWTAGTGTSFTLAGDGAKTVYAKQTDIVGNISSSGTLTFTLDATAPTVSDANIALSGATGTGGTFKIGDVVMATWNNTSGGDNNADVATVSVNFSQFGGGSAVTASNSSGIWTATYTIISGSINATNLNVSVTATDIAGNAATTVDGSNATVVNTPPVVTAPADVTVDATGLFTAVDIGTATAVDAYGAALSTSSDAPANFAPGTYTVTWSATDAAGNIGTATQTVNVNPQVSFDKDQMTAEGATVTFRVILNGPAVSYPVTVPYTVGGTATSGSDHNLVNGNITINSGTQASVSFTTVNDGLVEGTESVVITMGTPTNAVPGAHKVDTIDIVDANVNVPPAVSLSADQGAGPTHIIVVGNGPVTVSSTVNDPNTGDTHTYDWTGTDNALTDTDGVSDTFTFDPSALSPGFYTLYLNVNDGTAASDAVLILNVLATAPTHSSTDDSDGDGITDAVEGYGDADGDGIPDYMDAIASSNELQEIQGQIDRFLIETEPGLQLNLGNVAIRSGLSQAKVSMSNIVSYGGAVADSSYQYSGGLFDFTIDGIPLAGQSIQVVLPQQAAIPANATYRKVVGNVWQSFVEDTNNSVASAAGVQGYCPPPGDSAYTSGLTEGNWCLQLTIEDGGPNDADAVANNSVADPGGVASIQNSGTLRVSSGGGSGSPWLLVLLGVLLWRTRLVQREAEE